MKKKDLISIADLTEENIGEILDVAEYIKEKHVRKEDYQPLKNKTVGLIFQKPSTRTRVSFQVGAFQLGGEANLLDVNSLQVSRGETVGDTAMVLSRYFDAVVIRGKHKFLTEFAENATIPVINGLTELFHPCQILSDLLTLKEKGKKLKGLKLVFVGDGNNICNSLMLAAGKTGMKMTASCPRGYTPSKKIVAMAKKDAAESGGRIDLNDDPEAACKYADVIYTDTWVSMGQEAESKKRLKAFKPYQVNKELLKQAKPGCFVMHCLPAHRGQEITSDVLDGKNSIVWDEAENRLHAQKAIMALYIK